MHHRSLRSSLRPLNCRKITGFSEYPLDFDFVLQSKYIDWQPPNFFAANSCFLAIINSYTEFSVFKSANYTEVSV